jgi:hypothetical protein
MKQTVWIWRLFPFRVLRRSQQDFSITEVICMITPWRLTPPKIKQVHHPTPLKIYGPCTNDNLSSISDVMSLPARRDFHKTLRPEMLKMLQGNLLSSHYEFNCAFKNITRTNCYRSYQNQAIRPIKHTLSRRFLRDLLAVE